VSALPKKVTSALLYPFQEKAIEEMLHFLRTGEAHGVYNACSQGLGKSCMSVYCADALKAKNILILCPKSVLLNWLAEFKKWSIIPRTYIALFSSSQVFNALVDAKHNVVVMSYDLAKQPEVMKVLITRMWDLLIIDEAHALKSRSSQRAKAILSSIWPKAKYRIALSATPITNTVVDAFTLFTKLAPSIFTNYYEFINCFANIDHTPWGDKPYGIKNSDALKKIIRSRFFIRYTKEEVGIDLPPKIFTKIALPKEYAYTVPHSEAEVLKAEVSAVVHAIEKGNSVPAVPTTIAGYRKAQALKTLPAVIDFVANIVDQKIPLVVFTYHTEVLQNLKAIFTEHNPAIIYGAVSAKDREKEVLRFQNGETDLFFGQIIAGGTGINLQRSSNVVFAELDYSPANIEQALSRCHRIGSKNTVNIYYFVTEGSIEARIIEILMDKTQVFLKMMEN
jgi:SWI/SNF-related matrix-associated actin-dependent regulator 1 of chromatin subfamily A